MEMCKTVLKQVETELIIKKSKFISHVKPIENEEQAQLFILQIKKKHYNASHNVFAYQIGFKNEVQRYSDDGEPSGTAGLPMLDTLRNGFITNVVVVVTRYFGGILLGTGGLTRAYRESCKLGLDSATIITKKLYQKISIETDYNLSGKVQFKILTDNHTIIDTIYTHNVIYIVLVEEDLCDNFKTSIVDITNNMVTIKYLEKLYS